MRALTRRSTLALLSVLFSSILAAPGWAETILEKIARTEVFTAGARTDTVPFGYHDEKGEWVGYSIDMIEQIHRQIEQKLSKPVELKLVPVTSDDWVVKLQENQVDLVCSSISITQGRLRDVAFSVAYFRTGTQFLIKKTGGSASSRLRIGVIPRTTNDEVVRTYLRLAQFVDVPSRRAGITALNQGRIDALASDGILLEGLRQTLPTPEQYDIFPSRPYSPETYGCALPKNEPSLQTLVNQTLIGFMQGVLTNNQRAVTIFDTWFGSSGVAPVDYSQITDFFRQTIAAYQQDYKPYGQNTAP